MRKKWIHKKHSIQNTKSINHAMQEPSDAWKPILKQMEVKIFSLKDVFLIKKKKTWYDVTPPIGQTEAHSETRAENGCSFCSALCEAQGCCSPMWLLYESVALAPNKQRISDGYKGFPQSLVCVGFSARWQNMTNTVLVSSLRLYTGITQYHNNLKTCQ